MSSLLRLLGYLLTHGLLLVLFDPSVTSLSQAPDGRCYLKEGNSGASFTVSELFSPGDTFGILEVGGNSSRNGDIVLTLQDNDMVRLVPESKRLVLIGKLDKEGFDGRNQLHVKVKCERKNSNDPAIHIPVRIVVQDANDNVPAFVNAPYVIQLSESMSPGMVISSDMIKAFDLDQPGPFSTIQYSVVPGKHSDILTFQSALAPTLVIKKQLDYEMLPNFTVTIKAQDQGQPPLFNTTTLTIHVLDADDQNPRFTNQSYFAILPSTNSPGDILEVEPAPLEALDQDKDLNVPVYYSFDTESADSPYFDIDSETGLVSLLSAIPLDMIFPVTLVIRATQINNEDRRDLTTLTVARNPVFSGLRFLSPLYLLSVPENLPSNSTLLRLQTNRPFDEFLQFFLKSDFEDQFAITDSGDLMLMQPLDFEKTEKMVLEIKVSSGSMSDSTSVELLVIDVNEHDPKFEKPIYRFWAAASTGHRKKSIGQLVTEDEDRDDTVSLSLIGTNAKAFGVDKMGHVFVNNSSFLNASITHLIAVATDSGNPPRRSSVPLEIIVPDDVLASAGVLSGDSTFFLMIIFGVSLGILFIVIIVLAIHIAKRKHQRERVGQAPIYPNHQPIGKMASYMSSSFPHQKLSGGGDSGNSSSDTETNQPSMPPLSSINGSHLTSLHTNRARMGVENPIFHESSSPQHMLTNGHSSAMENKGSTSSTDDIGCSSHEGESDEDGETKNNKITVTSVRCTQKTLFRQPKNQKPQPHPVCTCTSSQMESSEQGLDEDMSDLRKNIIRFGGSCMHDDLDLKRSSMKLRSEPAIPKRVKKLSWEDEQTQKPTLLDPEVSVTPFTCKHTKSMDHPELAVYF